MSPGLRHSSGFAAVCGAPLPVGPFVAVVAIYVAVDAAEPPQGVVAFVVDVSVSSVAYAEEAFVVEVFADVVVGDEDSADDSSATVKKLFSCSFYPACSILWFTLRLVVPLACLYV